MVHPALHLLASRPQWLAEHATAYGQLVGAELGDISRRWRRQALLAALSLLALGVGATLAGVAAMAWLLMPGLPGADRAALLAVPLLPLLLGGIGLEVLRRAPPGDGLSVLRQQWEADMSLLREMAAS